MAALSPVSHTALPQLQRHACQTPSPPRVLSFGDFNCGYSTDRFTSPMGDYPDLHYVGGTLPDADANELLRDYDVIVCCAWRFQLSPEQAQTVVEFVMRGGGLYLASEYIYGYSLTLNRSWIEQINVVARPLGAEFQPTVLDWGEATGSAWLDCEPL